VIRVVVVDDHVIVRRGLAQLCAIDPDLQVVAEVADGEGALAAVDLHRPDVVLMDLSMPCLDGVEATRRIKASHPEVPVVILTSFSDQARILAAIEAGAVGYLLKDAEPEELIRAVHAAVTGDAPFSPRAARALLTLGSARQQFGDLTPRELDVLGCLAEGLSNKEIAARLGIAQKTVKAHLMRVFQRIGVRDRTQAALWFVARKS
jgi:DNA-binding NarL/FixJ family response regulator